MTISGTGFVPGATTVRFAGDIRASVVSVTAAQLVVTVPVGAQSGPIAVTTPGGTVSSAPFTVTLPQDFTLTASPASLSLVQNSANTFSIGLSTSGAAAFTSLVRLSTQGLPTDPAGNFLLLDLPAGAVTLRFARHDPSRHVPGVEPMNLPGRTLDRVPDWLKTTIPAGGAGAAIAGGECGCN